MYKFRKIICAILAFAVLSSVGFSALAATPGESRVVIGANLSEEQINTVYSMFDVTRGEITELTVTNDEERQYLEGIVSDSAIGTRSISCVLIRTLEENEGLHLKTTNINWCTDEIYKNTLITAGIYDADVIVAAPFEVSGTAALTGIYKAYEDITGKELSEDAKAIAVEELVITSDLADEIGSADAALIVNELKAILDETNKMTDEELSEEIRSIAIRLEITITEEQIEKLISLVRSMENLDTNTLIAKVESLQSAVQKMSDSGFFNKFRSFFQSVFDFFARLFA